MKTRMPAVAHDRPFQRGSIPLPSGLDQVATGTVATFDVSSVTINYSANVNRQKTKKWAEAKPANYGGDDWGDDDDYFYDPPPPPAPKASKQAELRQQDIIGSLQAQAAPEPWTATRSASPGNRGGPPSPNGKSLPFIRPKDIYRRVERDRNGLEQQVPSLDHDVIPLATTSQHYDPLDRLQELATSQLTQIENRILPYPKSPKLPDLRRMSGFGMDLFSQSEPKETPKVSQQVQNIEASPRSPLSPSFPLSSLATPEAVAESSSGQNIPASENQGSHTTSKRALIQYDYEKAEDNELGLIEGEYVTNIETIDEDWWFGTNSKGETGLFPSNYVELVESDDALPPGAQVPELTALLTASTLKSIDVSPGPPDPTATAIYQYEAAEDNELSFNEGDTITGLEFPDEDWWFGYCRGESGLFPANYVQIDEKPKPAKMAQLAKEASARPPPTAPANTGTTGIGFVGTAIGNMSNPRQTTKTPSSSPTPVPSNASSRPSENTNISFHKGATFRSSSTSEDGLPHHFKVPSLPSHSQTALENVIDAIGVSPQPQRVAPDKQESAKIEVIRTEVGAVGVSLQTEQVVPDKQKSAAINFIHTEYASYKVVPFTTIKQLGYGSFGIVDEVRSSGDEQSVPMARKVIRLPGMARKRLLALIRQEVAILRELSHQHIIKVLCTYETTSVPRQFGILLSPVGEEDLLHYMERVGDNDFLQQDIDHLKKWRFCLASAVQYIHSRNIRHKDIKPSNAICKGNEIFLTDFGSAHQFSGLTSATEGYAAGVTKMYSAPEVIEEDRRGRSADVFSLGCVFAEMTTVIHGRRVEDFHDFRSEADPDEPDRMTLCYYATAHKMMDWFASDNNPAQYALISSMTAADQTRRPTAHQVMMGVAEQLLLEGLETCSCMRDHLPLGP